MLLQALGLNFEKSIALSNAPGSWPGVLLIRSVFI
jgi:hypothetical protein